MSMYSIAVVAGLCGIFAGCSGMASAQGEQGQPGERGAVGPEGPAGKDASLSGTRLRAQYVVGGDGSQERTADWLDSETGVACRYLTTGDGEKRCLPAEIVGAQIDYIDPNCTTVVLWTNSEVPVPAYGRAYSSSDEALLAVKTGVGATVPEVLYAFNGSNQCVALPADPLAAYFYEITILPPEFFVQGSLVTEEVGQ